MGCEVRVDDGITAEWAEVVCDVFVLSLSVREYGSKEYPLHLVSEASSQLSNSKSFSDQDVI